jgi:hypothetical protein
MPKTPCIALAGAFVLAVWMAPALRADNDWLGIEVPRPLDSGVFDVNVKAGECTNETWAEGGEWDYMVLPDGTPAEQTLATVDTRLDWKASRRLWVEADIPLVFSQFGPPQASDSYTLIGTPDVSQTQGLGDVRLGLRGCLQDRSEGSNQGWTLSVVAPTGLGPFEASTPLAATGAGRWQILPGAVVGGLWGPWEAWVQLVGRLQLGRQEESSSQAYLSWRSGTDADGNITWVDNVSLPDGGVWLGPRYGGDLTAGFSWNWYRTEDARMGLALEALYHYLSPWTLSSGPIGVLPEEVFVLTPEVQARYGRFSAVVGWQAEDIWAQEVPAATYGEILFDVSYGF